MFRQLTAFGLICLAGLAVAIADDKKPAADGWVSLFDGKTFDGWKVNENKESFSIQDGMLVVKGKRSHLFYDGPVNNAKFTNFEFKADIMTKPKANSGIFFHTKFQESGWPGMGYEAQVNNSHTDPVRTGSLYFVDLNKIPPAKDNEWFTQHIIVKGKHITIKVNDKVIVDRDEKPEDTKGDRKLSSGTFAIQAHDPESVVYFKNIMVKPLD
jgi:hypothetical protein